LAALARAGIAGGDPLEQVRALLLDLFVAFPVCEHVARRGRRDVAEYVRVADHELVVDAPRDVGQVEQALFLRERRVEQHLAQEVPELFRYVGGHCGWGAGRVVPSSSMASIAS